jgi:condensin complex subunit 3
LVNFNRQKSFFMSTLTETQQIIASSFNKAQKTSSCHPNCFETLKELKKKDSKEFLKSFIQMMKPALVHFKSESYVERIIQFIIKFSATVDEKPEDFCCSFISEILQFTNSKDKAVRFRTCQIISGIISELPDDAEVE